MTTTALTSSVQFNDGSVQDIATGVKSVQSFFVFPKGTLTGDYGSSRAVNVTISAVNTGKTILIYPHFVRANAGYGAGLVYSVSAKFINSTTVQVCCFSTDNDINYLRFHVIEYY